MSGGGSSGAPAPEAAEVARTEEAVAAAPDAAGLGPPRRSPLVERLGVAAIMAVLGLLFVFVAVVSWIGGEAFLSFMGVLGAGVATWLGLRTLLRG